VNGFVIGCDVGSQGTNGALYAADGALVSSAYEAYDLSFPHPSWAEQDPDAWWAAAVNAIKAVVAQAPATRVAAVGISGQMHSLGLGLRTG